MENKIPTLKEIAKQLKLSVSTVSRALKDHPSIGLRTKMQVKQLAEELHYEPNQAALLFKQGKSNTVGVILPNFKEEFFSQAINGIEDIANQHGYSVLVGQSHDDIEKEKQIALAMKNQRVEGLVVSISKHTKDYSHLLDLQKYNIPVVFFDRVPNINDVYKVSSDIQEGTKQAVEFLIAQKHRYIGVINGPDEMQSCKERVKAYMDTLQRKRIKIDLALVETTDLTKEKTEEAMEKLLSLKRSPTAILTINDYVALDAIQYARKHGLKINEDICFVSYANLPITNYLEHPPLASVEQFPYKQAKKATEIIFDIIQGVLPLSPDNDDNNILIEGNLIMHNDEQ